MGYMEFSLNLHLMIPTFRINNYIRFIFNELQQFILKLLRPK